MILAGIKTYFESKGTQARRKKKDPAICKKLAKNQRRIHVSVCYITAKILWLLDFMRAKKWQSSIFL